MESFARLDNILAASQLSIGESSNLAQVCLTYTYNAKTDEELKKYGDYVCILSVLAQAAIDSAKRKFDVDINEEIKRIKEDINIKSNGFPSFWSVIRKDFNKSRINKELKCPMNCIYNIKLPKAEYTNATLPMSYFFNKYDIGEVKKQASKVEAMIKTYSLELMEFNMSYDDDNINEYLLLRNDFENLIMDIKETIKPDKYVYIFSWLINRAFLITPQIQKNKYTIKTHINKNKSLLLKTLYEVNPDSLLKVFSAKNGIPEEKKCLETQ